MFLTVLDFLYPPTCAVCQQSLGSTAGQRRFLCEACDPSPAEIDAVPTDDNVVSLFEYVNAGARLEAPSSQCNRCGEPTLEENGARQASCVACSLWPPPTYRLLSRLQYDEKAEAVLKAFKYGGHHCLAGYIAEQIAVMLFDDLLTTTEPRWDVIVGLPSSPESIRSRGYGHISLVARRLSRMIAVPFSSSALRAARPRKRQVDCTLYERSTNVADAFVARPTNVSGKSVLLLDDVVTTGASIWSAATTLIDAGAKRVDGVTFARSPRFRTLRYASGLPSFTAAVSSNRMNVSSSSQAVSNS